jgi:hypothetical protein
MCCRQLCAFLEYENLDVKKESDLPAIRKYLAAFLPPVDKFLQEINTFLHIEPKLPGCDKAFIDSPTINFSVDDTRQQIIDYLGSIRQTNITADLAFYAYRDMQSCDWLPFTKAAIERNPVSIEAAKSMSLDDIYDWLGRMPNESIYDAKRLAQPDEVANYNRGDGLEKAFLLAAVAHNRNPQQDIKITVNNNKVLLKAEKNYEFISSKGLTKEIKIPIATSV